MNRRAKKAKPLAAAGSGRNKPDVDALAGGAAGQTGRVFKAGNSLAVRIPKMLAHRLSFEEGSAVEITIDSGALRVRKPPIDIEALIDSITPDTLHDLVIDNFVGKEVW